MYGIGAVVAFVLVGVGMHLMGMPDAIVGPAASGVSILILGLGNIHGADAATVEAFATKLSGQVNDVMPVVQSTVAKVKEDLTALHNVNAQQIAVHAAVLSVPATTSPKPEPVEPDKPHLVT